MFFELVYKFLISDLSSLLDSMLHYLYIVTSSKIIIYYDIIGFCLQTHKIYLELNIPVTIFFYCQM